MPLIEVDNVTFSYPAKDGGVNALTGLNLKVEAGSFVTVLGSNGSGKSTLGKLLNALLVPQSGRVVVDGLCSSDKANVYEIRKRVGIVFQNPDNQIVADTVEDDVAFGPENIGLALDQMKVRIADSLASTGISDLALTKPEKLSGGQKQRVAIAGVMALEPKCIVLDESTSMLDPKGRTEVLGAIQKLRMEKGIAVILITHYMEEAVDADYVYVLDKGSVALEGTPSEVFSDADTLEALGLELPPAVKVWQMLRAKGVVVSVPVLTEEDLVSALSKLMRQKGGASC
ncbi:MAG: energy-coupling factor transporter ATPase [Sphaerochaetaceae bacterium]|nr:energy-coupling factor transporter ATPase [Sphaerochaetaceae bacterium]